MTFRTPLILWLLLPTLLGLFFWWVRRRGTRPIWGGLSVVALLLLAAGPVRLGETVGQTRIVLFDGSRSYEPYRPRGVPLAVAWLREGRTSDRVAWITWAGVPSRLFGPVGLGAVPATSLPGEAIESRSSRLLPALHDALELLNEGDGEILLLTDGRVTGADVESGLDRARTAGVPIHTMDVEARPFWDASVLGVQAPGFVPVGRPFPIDVRVRLDAVSSAREARDLTVSLTGLKAPAQTIRLLPGTEARVRFEAGVQEPGLASFAVSIVSKDGADRFPENDRLQGAVQGGSQRVGIWVGPERSLPEGLDTGFQMLRFDRIPDPSILGSAEVLVLDDRPLNGVTEEARRRLAAFVRGGGSLLLLGGDANDGFADYGGTILERISPVQFAPPPPRTAVFVLLDRSGSMAETLADGRTKLAVAAATLVPMEGLGPDDTFGLFAFSDAVEPLLPVGSHPDPDVLSKALRSLEPAGETRLGAALLEVSERLAKKAASRQLCLVLTDGRSTDSLEPHLDALAERFEPMGTRLVLLAVGREPALESLGELAERTGGELERVAIGDGSLRRWLREEWAPTLRDNPIRVPSPVRLLESDHAVAGWPGPEQVGGHARVEARATGQSVLETRGDPLLVLGRHGEGRVAVFCSTVAGEWAEMWPLRRRRVWLGRLVDFLAPPVPRRALRVEARWEGDRVRIRVRNEKERPESLAARLRLRFEPGGEERFCLRDGPRSWTGRFPVPRDAIGFVLSDGKGGAIRRPLPPRVEPEVRRVGLDRERLKRMARQTGGEYGTRPPAPIPGRRPARMPFDWPFALAAGLFLILASRRR